MGSFGEFRNSRSVVLIDVDGVLAEFSTKFHTTARDLSGKDIPIIPHAEQVKWDMPAVPKKIQKLVWKEIYEHPEWWLDLDALPRAGAILSVAKKYFGQVFIVTARHGDREAVERVTAEWMRRKFPGAHFPVFAVSDSGDKIPMAESLARFVHVVVVDDSPVLFRKIARMHTLAHYIKVLYPYNKEIITTSYAHEELPEVLPLYAARG